MFESARRPPERVPLVCSPNLAGTTFTTKLPAELVSTKLPAELAPARPRRAADRAGLIDCLVVIVKMTLTFDPKTRRSAVPKQEADCLSGEFFKQDDPEGRLLYGGDFAPYKRHVDVTLSPPAKLEPSKERSLKLGPMQRKLVNGHIQDFGPLHPFAPPRSQQLGTFDDAWLRDRWPYFPKDFDFGYFNVAPISQRLEHLRGDEALEIGGFEAEDVQTRLPGVTVRAFAQGARTTGYRFEELSLRLDTLHIALADTSIQLVWRGQAPVSDALAPELTHVYACADRVGAPMPTRAARDQFARLVEKHRLDDDELATSAAGVPRSFGIASLGKHSERDKSLRALKAPREPSGGTPPPRPAVRPAMSREEVERLVRSGESLEDRDFTACDLRDLNLSERNLNHSIFTAADLSRATLSRASLEAAVLSHARLTACDLRGAMLSESNLSCAELSRAALVGASLQNAELDRANLSGANLHAADLTQAKLTACLLEGADLSEANLSGADLTQAQAAGANFRKAMLPDTIAYELYAPEAIFDEAITPRLRAGEADLRRASFRGVEGAGSNFDGSNLEQACFDLATFDDASLAHCKLRGAKLRRMRARSASFRHSCLAETDLRRADLMQASFEQADLRGADLRSSNLFEVETLDAELDGVRTSGADTSGSKLCHPLLGIKE